MAKVLDGKQIAADYYQELHEQIKQWTKQNGHRAPQLTIIWVGEEPSCTSFWGEIVKASNIVGIRAEKVSFNTDVKEKELLERIEELNGDDSVDGILVMLPLPEHISARTVWSSMSCDKDVEGMNERNTGKLCLDMNTLIPCSALALKELIIQSGIETFGKNAVVVGRSKHKAMPIAMILHSEGKKGGMDATVTICHENTPQGELARFCRSADIIVTATGIPRLIKADMVKEGAAVFDAGMFCEKDPATGKNKWIGDVDFEEVRKVASVITPVPGGVGPMTVAMLMKNTFNAAQELARNKKGQQ